MNAWHYRWLCQLAYIDLPQDGNGMRGKHLSKIAAELLRMDEGGALSCGGLSEGGREALKVILETQKLGELMLVDYVNRNADSGLAAYVLRSGDGGIHCIFRGSETRGCGVPSSVDWRDNFSAPFYGSVQYEGVETLAERFRGRRIVFSGHSKGAHNALYALSLCGGGARATVFNGQGFAPGQLSREARICLRERGVNYVVCGDAVGAMLYHPEKRIFVKKQGEGSAHALSAFSLDETGEAVTCARPLWSAALEWATRSYVRMRNGRGKYGNVVNRIASAPHS